MKKLLSLLLLLSTILVGQVNDKNFKSSINGGLVVAVFTSEWQEQPFDKDIVSGIEGYEDAEIIFVKSEDAPKATKKLRLRNFPSVVLFKNGKKVKVWKADFDGNLDLTTEQVRKAIDWHSAVLKGK